MARKLHSAQSDFPYHVTARSHDGIWFRISPDRAWRIMSDYLYFISFAYNVKIHAFVMMSNHFHLIISTPDANLSEAMNYFMRETSKEINRLTGRKNQLFGNRFYRSVVTSNLHFEHVYKYVYRNPVTAGVVDICEKYPYSTLHGVLGQTKITLPVAEDTILFNGHSPEKILKWLNTQPTQVNYDTLRKSLRRKTLKFPKNRWSPDRHTLEMNSY